MAKITRWRPDTCDCTIDMTFNDAGKNLLSSSHVKRCGQHQLTSADDVQAENVLKNNSLKIIGNTEPSYKLSDGSIDSSKVSWSFNHNRLLLITISDKSKITAIQTVLDNELGANKVLVV